MKNFKKVIALVLAVAMTLSTFTTAFAAETANDAKATTLHELGLFAGTSADEFVPALEDGATRAQAIKIIGTSLGWDVEDVTTVEGFDDVPAWAAPYVAYAVENEITNGIATDKFGSSDPVTERQVLTWYYRALGFDGNVWSTPSLLVTAKIASQATVDGIVAAALAGEEEGINRDAIVGIMYASLQWKADGKTTTLVEDLIAANVIVEADAIKAGVYVKPVVPFAVASASANNLKEVTVAFNKAGDAAKLGDVANYTVNAVAPVAAKVADDNMSVRLTLNVAVAQQGTMEVKVLKAVGLDADATVKAEKVLDTTVPTVESIALTGPKEFTITFSEPINTITSVTVNNGVYGVSNPVLSADRRVATVALSAALVTGNNYDVKVTGAVDYATFTAPEKTLVLAYVKDTTAPTVELVSASQTEVKIKFSKKVFVGGVTLDSVNYFYQTYTAWKPVDVSTTDDQTFTLTFKDNDGATTDYYLPVGTSVVTVLKSVSDVKILDAWGNELAADAKLNATVTADTLAPTVTKVAATAENKLEVTFDEDVTAAAGNFTIKKGADKADTGNIVLGYADKKATLTFDKKLAGGTYTVEVKDVTDKSLAGNKIATVTLEFVVTDKTPATVSATVVETLSDGNAEFVYLTFSEAMTTSGAGSILDLANYQLDGAAMPDGSKVELFLGSTSKVKLTVPSQTATLVALEAVSRITVGQVADVAGNKIVALATKVAVAADAQPTVDSIRTIATNKVSITITGLLDTATVTADGLTIDANNDAVKTALASIISVEKKDGKTTVVAYLNAGDVVPNSNALVISAAVVANKWKSETGKEAVAGALSFTDGIAPAITAITQTGTTEDEFTVTFDEAITAASASLAATDFVIVNKDGNTLLAGVDYTVDISGGTTAVITLASAYTVGAKIKIDTKDAIVYIKDATGGEKLTVYGDAKEITVADLN